MQYNRNRARVGMWAAGLLSVLGCAATGQERGAGAGAGAAGSGGQGGHAGQGGAADGGGAVDAGIDSEDGQGGKAGGPSTMPIDGGGK